MKWGDLITLEYGKPIKDKSSSNGPVPVYGTNGKIGTSFLPPLCRFPSFILGRKGAYRGVHYSDTPFSVIDTAFYAKSKTDKLDLKWAYYKFLTYDINNMDSGSAIPSTDRYEIYSIDVSLPSLTEQKRIISILEAFDKKILLNKNINDNLEQQAIVLVNKYFSATTETVALSEIMNFANGFAFQSSTYLPAGQYRIITIKNVQDGQIDSTGAAYIDCLPKRMKTNCILKVGDVILSLTGNVGRVGIVCENNLLLNQRVAKLVPYCEKILPLIYFIFRQPIIKMKMESIAKGTAQLNLSPIETLSISIPFKNTTALDISKVLSPIYESIISNNQQIILLASLRDTLLPKLGAVSK